MSMNAEFLLIVFTIVLVIALYAVWEYNALISFRVRIDNAWNQMYELVTSRRIIVTQFMNAPEVQIDEAVRTRLKTLIEAAIAAKTVKETLVVEKQISEELAQLFATPGFFADTPHGTALRTLHTVDQRLALAQMLYNDIVLVYLNKLESFPANVIANIYNFSTEPLSE